ncbi:hypothetical protein KGQ64_05990, partial [bacterium]|nr:hypothetical protein [bacterium]
MKFPAARGDWYDTGHPMDLPSRLLTLAEDLVELPRFLEVKRALDAAARDGMKTMGRVCREQAERIPDRVALRF